MSILLLRRRRPIAEPGDSSGHGSAIRNAPGGEARRSPSADAIVATLDGTAGAGRLCTALLGLGIELAGVRQAVIQPEAAITDLDAIDLNERYERVVLGSHLVNHPEPDRRAVLLALAARHLVPGGTLLVEHHPIDWAETATATEATPGADVGMEDVRREPPYVSAVSTFDVGGRFIRQPFTARVLSEDELAGAIRATELEPSGRLSPTWLEARRPAIEE